MRRPALSHAAKAVRHSHPGHRLRQAAAVAAVLVCGAGLLLAQTSDAAPQTEPSASLADSLQRAKTMQLHIFYVHGIGAGGPDDYDSQLLRTSICNFLTDCTTKAGELDGTEYADQDAFALNAPPPRLAYLGEPVWKSETPGGRSEEWNASAPYVDHWKLLRRNAPPIYVDEINWWPLVFALKCRRIVAGDAALVGPNRPYLKLCSTNEPDQNHPGRYRLYPWIPPADAQKLQALPSQGALINRSLKNNLLDWNFSDALLAVGPIQPYLLDGIRQLVLKSASVTADGTRGGGAVPGEDQEFVIVSHSLGSYLIFSALDYQASGVQNQKDKDWEGEFQRILSRTSIVYFLANQLRFLELANLDTKRNQTDHLRRWIQLRTGYLATQTDATRKLLAPPQIVAWSDPSDLLTWDMPKLEAALGNRVVFIRNRHVRNAIRWFWLFEAPTSAHDNYAANKKVIRVMLKASRKSPS